MRWDSFVMSLAATSFKSESPEHDSKLGLSKELIVLAHFACNSKKKKKKPKEKKKLLWVDLWEIFLQFLAKFSASKMCFGLNECFGVWLKLFSSIKVHSAAKSCFK